MTQFKRLLTAFILLSTFSVGCEREEHVMEDVTVTATFEICVPGGVTASKALSTFGNGCMAPKDLTVVVLDETGTNEIMRSHFPGKFTKDQTVTDVRISLVNGKSYTVAFWAQYEGATAFDISDITAVKVNYDGAASSDESRDAFCAAYSVKVEGDFIAEVILKRPFAQLNFATNDLPVALNAGYEEFMAKVEVRGIPNVYNVVTGVASGKVNASFNYAYFPGLTGGEQVSEIVENVDDILIYKVSEGSHKWTKEELVNAESTFFELLATNYVLVGRDEYTASQVNLSVIKTRDDKEPLFTHSITDVPCHANWRTNMFGNLLTGVSQCRIQILESYQGEYIH